ncbi:TAXI family TRAP transporter solute-binding subunit [Fodinicurvata sp. EGI_FJ10296]|uniref:TAXI family TRAP transporter solute-binding subunit n=1 Tax=Fodinicurvata sp. EGI_FJ10296 TaxID=3231908 RepID=UPI003452EB2B
MAKFSGDTRMKGLLAATAAGLALTVSVAHAQDDRLYILGTATTGGTYYPVGVAVGTLSQVQLRPTHGFSLNAISTAGSGENVRLMRDNEIQFAIVQGIFGAWAVGGEEQFEEPQDYMRSISMLWPNVEHFVVYSDHAETGTIPDLDNLEGEAFSIGARDSGTEGSGRTILGNLGYDVDNHFEVVYQGYGPSAESMQNRNIEGMNIPGGPPVAGVTEAFANLGNDITILEFTEEQREQANGPYSLWTEFVIEAGTYPNLDRDITTIAQPNFLAVRNDVAEEDVYELTKAMYENLDFLRGIHPATGTMSLETAIGGLPAPLHPGALRYYEEQGLEIPDNLRP